LFAKTYNHQLFSRPPDFQSCYLFSAGSR
jgi:hypothetical protein